MSSWRIFGIAAKKLKGLRARMKVTYEKKTGQKTGQKSGQATP
jgi:hypothetical protein